MSNATVIGIDHGNNMIKTVHTEFSSNIISNGKQAPLNTQEYLLWEGTYYLIDNTAHAGFAPNKADSEATNDVYFKLTLMAIAKELAYTDSYIRAATPENPMLIELAIGLPPLHASTHKEQYQKYFAWGNKPITFSYGKETYHIRIVNVQVFSQGFVAICSNDSRVVEFRRKFPSYYVVDIGGYTMDCMLVKRDTGIEYGKCETLSIGVNNLVNDIQRVFTRSFSSPCEESIIIDELRGKDTGMPENRRNLITSCREDYARFICSQLKDKQFDIESIPTIFVGGGSILFEESLRKFTSINPNSLFINDIHANAAGYQRLARWGQENTPQES